MIVKKILRHNKKTGEHQLQYLDITTDPITVLEGVDIPQEAIDYCCACSSANQDVAQYAESIPTTIQTAGPITIPAGACYISVKNAGITSSGGISTSVSATVDGQPFDVNRSENWKGHFDPVAKTFKKLPAMVINGNGNMMWISYQN